MGPYYAALLSSARGDTDATLRQLLLFEARWSQVTGQRETAQPPWLRASADGQSVGAVVTTAIADARRLLPRDVAEAHVRLESIRGVLRSARTRFGVATVDDAVTDYHDALERLSSHIGERQEVTLVAGDFAIILQDVNTTRDRWTQLRTFKELSGTLVGWDSMDRTTTNLINAVATAARNNDGLKVQHAGQELKTNYLKLISELSRWRRP
jgi:hypothetical protein